MGALFAVKHPELKDQFDKASPSLKTVLYYVMAYAKHRYGGMVTITMLDRTQDEQDNLYSADPTYADAPRRSYHQVRPCQACDLRYWSFNFEQWTDIMASLEEALGSYIPMRTMIHDVETYTAAQKAGKFAHVPHVHIEVHKP